MAELNTNIPEIRKTIETLSSGIVEVRMYDDRKIITSGYFKPSNSDNLFDCLKNIAYENCYFTLNAIKEDCYSRDQCERLCRGAKLTTSDKDIETRRWLLIDVDPVRSSGISSSDAEKDHARRMIVDVYRWLRDIGFADPVIADSGNGYHLLYRIDIKNADEVTELIKNFLKYLDMIFSSDTSSVDTSVYNASRITKLYGAVTRKGANTTERPHRQSKILKTPPDGAKINNVSLIQKVADMLPQPEQKQYLNNAERAGQFDIHDFMRRHLRVSREVQTPNGVKYLLEECPFNPAHKSPDSMIAVMNSGAIGFRCLHSSCTDKKWQDVRELCEPKAQRQYDTSRTTTANNRNVPNTTETAQSEKPPARAGTDPQIKQYYQLHEISSIDRSKIVSIPTGVKALDSKVIGFNKKEVTVISGNNGSGKSTIIGQFILNGIDAGFRSTLFSGEMTKERIKTWLHLQAAGRQYTKQSQYGEHVYFTPNHISEYIDAWTKGRLFIHNNLAGVKFADVLKTVEETVSKEKTDIVYIDNLMAIDISGVTGDKLERQTSVILKIVEIAKTYDIHIVFVCHPRKAVGFLRKNDISGTADLTNAVDNVIMCHRINEDFRKEAADFLGAVKVSEFLKKEYANCIEIMKNRDLGFQDELIGLYFEKESKRFLNERFENRNYGWQENYVKSGLDELAREDF